MDLSYKTDARWYKRGRKLIFIEKVEFAKFHIAVINQLQWTCPLWIISELSSQQLAPVFSAQSLGRPPTKAQASSYSLPPRFHQYHFTIFILLWASFPSVLSKRSKHGHDRPKNVGWIGGKSSKYRRKKKKKKLEYGLFGRDWKTKKWCSRLLIKRSNYCLLHQRVLCLSLLHLHWRFPQTNIDWMELNPISFPLCDPDRPHVFSMLNLLMYRLLANHYLPYKKCRHEGTGHGRFSLSADRLRLPSSHKTLLLLTFIHSSTSSFGTWTFNALYFFFFHFFCTLHHKNRHYANVMI